MAFSIKVSVEIESTYELRINSMTASSLLGPEEVKDNELLPGLRLNLLPIKIPVTIASASNKGI